MKNQLATFRSLLTRDLCAVLFLSSLSGQVLAEVISITSTFVAPFCDTNVSGVPSSTGECFSRPFSIAMVWSLTDAYCGSLGNGYSVPTKDQLIALYNTYPGNQLNAAFGWDTSGYYWSSTMGNSGNHYMVRLDNGFESQDFSDNTLGYLTCVRPQVSG